MFFITSISRGGCKTRKHSNLFYSERLLASAPDGQIDDKILLLLPPLNPEMISELG